jgi:hypothetical protein
MRSSSVVLSVCTSLSLCLMAAPVAAQYVPETAPKRFEITPVAGYMWGGSIDTRPGSSLPVGSLRFNDSFTYGAIISFLAAMGSAVELSYQRQDTQIQFEPAAGGSLTTLGDFAVNYIQFGGRQEFGHSEKIRPFVSGSLGVGIFDPGEESLGSDTRFSWSIGGGLKYTLANGKFGIRSDIKLWSTPIPSGEVGVWCGFYSCVAAEGTDWVTQGQWSGGLVFAF